MKNEHGKEDRLLNIFSINGQAEIRENSALDSVAAVYGTILTASDMDDLEVKICVDKDLSVEVINTNSNTEMLRWNDEYAEEQGSIFLLYVLSEKAEFLLYKSPVPDRNFHISAVPVRNPLTGEILSKVESLSYFKAYREMADVFVHLVQHPYKNKYSFIFKRDDL